MGWGRAWWNGYRVNIAIHKISGDVDCIVALSTAISPDHGGTCDLAKSRALARLAHRVKHASIRMNLLQLRTYHWHESAEMLGRVKKNSSDSCYLCR